MRPSTQVALRMESVGRPHLTRVTDPKPLSQAIHDLAVWLAETSMGHRITITMARTREELEQTGKAGTAADLESIFDTILKTATGGDEDESE